MICAGAKVFANKNFWDFCILNAVDIFAIKPTAYSIDPNALCPYT